MNNETGKSAIPLVKERIKSSLLWLEENGFTLKEKTSEWDSNYVYEYEKWETWYGRYTCQVFFNTHRIFRIYEHFTGAATGIEGWSRESFNGEIESKEDFMVMLKLTGAYKRLQEWNEK